MRALVETEGMVKDYRVGTQVVHALRGVRVEIGVGEFVAVMGPSGSGKSTFMNLLGCLDTLTAGRYTLDGDDVSHLSRDALARIRNRKIGFVFQGFNLLPRTSARALINDPVLILADEPTGNLDSRTSLEIMAVFQELNRNGITVVLVTHEADVARHARRTLTFRDGRLITDDLVSEPTDARHLLSTLTVDELVTA